LQDEKNGFLGHQGILQNQGMPQTINYRQISEPSKTFRMQIQYVENSHSKATENLVESLPVKEDEKLSLEIISRQNTCAMDVIGLLWIFAEDDYS